MATHTFRRHVQSLFVLLCMLLAGCISTDNNLSNEVSGSRGKAYAVSRQAQDAIRKLPIKVPAQNILGLTDYPDKEIVEIDLGPIDFHSKKYQMMLSATSLPFDAYIHGFDLAVVDTGGHPLSRTYLHHLNVIQPAEREWFSPIARRLLAVGAETPGSSVPGLIGIPVKAGEPLLVIAMLMNQDPSFRTMPTVRLWLSYSRPGTQWIGPFAVYPFYLDAAGFTGPKEFPVPPGTSRRSWAASPAVNGRILGIGGHMHPFAEYLLLRDETQSRVLWEVRPDENPEGRVLRVPSDLFFFSGGKHVYHHHRYRTEVAYRNPLDRPSPDKGMGTIGGIFLTSGEPGWDRADYTDPAYLADMAFVQEVYSGTNPQSPAGPR